MRTILLAFCLTWLSQANAGTILITEQEASLPAKPGMAFDSRGVTRGPRVELVQPGESAYSPMRFQVRFLVSGGASIDPTKLRVTYLKTPESGSEIMRPSRTLCVIARRRQLRWRAAAR
jgi:hypothetical protein